MKIYCKKCKSKVVMDAFSSGACQVCGDEVFSPHMPVDKVCNNCAEDFNLCESCGKQIKDE